MSAELTSCLPRGDLDSIPSSQLLSAFARSSHGGWNLTFLLSASQQTNKTQSKQQQTNNKETKNSLKAKTKNLSQESILILEKKRRIFFFWRKMLISK